MKLQAGNPDQMKAKALKVNKTAGLGNYATSLGDVLPKKKDRAPTVFVPSKRDPGAVKAPEMNLWERPTYVPDNNQYTRPGANDHLKFKSKGFMT